MKLKTFVKNNLSFLKNVTGSTTIYTFSAILNYVFNILLLRGLSPEAFGEYSSALGIITLLQIPSLAISSAVTKFIADNHGNNLKTFKKRIFWQFVLIAGVSSLIFYLLSPLISNVGNIPEKGVLLITVVLFLSFFGPISKGIYYGLDNPISASWLFLVESVLKIGICIFSINIFPNDISLPVLACGLPFLFTGILLLPFIGRKQENGNSSVKGKINFKEMFFYSLIYFFLSTPYTVDLFLVNPDFRPAYSALSLVEKVVYYAAISVTSVMFSKIANQSKAKKRKDTLIISSALTLFIGFSISIFYGFFPELISTYILKGDYDVILPYLAPFGIGMTLYALSYLIYNYFIFINFNSSLLYIIFTTALQVVLFIFRNDSLEQVVQNQMILFLVLFIGSLILLITKLRKRNLDDTGIEPVTSTM